MNFRSVEDAVEYLENRVDALSQKCDKQNEKIEKLETVLFKVLDLSNKNDNSPITQDFLHSILQELLKIYK